MTKKELIPKLYISIDLFIYNDIYFNIYQNILYYIILISFFF